MLQIIFRYCPRSDKLSQILQKGILENIKRSYKILSNEKGKYKNVKSNVFCQTSFSDIFFGLSSTEFHPHWIQTEGKYIFQSHPFPQSFTKV